MAIEILQEFHELWNSQYAFSYEEFYENYKIKYDIIKAQQKIVAQEVVPSLEKYKLQPNSMQVGFIANLKRIVELGEDRALLISATGVDIIIQTGNEKPVNSMVCGISETCLFSYIS